MNFAESLSIVIMAICVAYAVCDFVRPCRRLLPVPFKIRGYR